MASLTMKCKKTINVLSGMISNLINYTSVNKTNDCTLQETTEHELFSGTTFSKLEKLTDSSFWGRGDVWIRRLYM